MLQLDRIDLREIDMTLRWPFETSFGRTTNRRILIVRVYDRSGAIGYGECTAGEDPFYNHETIDTAWLIITGFVIPMLKDAGISDAAETSGALARIRGNLMAKGGVEAAIWDLEAKMADRPLWKHLGGTQTELACGVSIGLQSTTAQLIEKIRREVERGYQRIKIKIKPGSDIELVKAVRAEFPTIPLMVDANSAYTLNDAELFEQMDASNLMMIEQPLTPGDLIDHAKLQRQLRAPICLDESILSLSDARQAHEIGACRIINVKLGRVGGHKEARSVQEFALAKGIPVWCGGMLESGVGRAHNIAMSTLDGFTLPGDVSASERYWDEDIIDPPVTVSPRGTITPPRGPGIGYEVNEKRVEALVVRREEIKL